MKTILLLLAMAGGISDLKDAILFLSGASCLEEIDSQTVERLEKYVSIPIDINSCGRSRLLSCGLLNTFQTAVIIDYRTRSGDILSYEELALLDGFSKEYAEALKYFTVLKSRSAPGTAVDRRFHDDLTTRAVFDGTDLKCSVKNIASYGEVAELVLTSSGTISAAVYGRRYLGKVIVGDFNARFGQGIAMWSGFTISGTTSLASFRKNPSGFSPSHSFSDASLRGVAADMQFGRWTVSAAISFPGLRARDKVGIQPVVNVSRTGRSCTLGMTGTYSTASGNAHTSVDFIAGIPDLSFHGEMAMSAGKNADIALAAVGGVCWTPAYGKKVAFTARYYDTTYDGSDSGSIRSSSRIYDEVGISTGFSSGWLDSCIDWSGRMSRKTMQLKSVTNMSKEFVSGPFRFKPSARLTCRLKPGETVPLRTEIRLDAAACTDDWSLSGRYDAVWHKSRAWLWYADASFRKSHLRFTLFRIDEWDDRIYVYEPDAAGNFTVPAYYGRGWSVCAFISGRFCTGRMKHILSLRGSYTSYPWTVPEKPDRAGLKFQYVLSI